MMNWQSNVSLADYSTMRLGGTAQYLTEVTSSPELAEAIETAENRQLPVTIIGIGSNVIWRDGLYTGLVIVNRIQGFETFEEDETNTYLTIGGGEIWDSVVERSVQSGLSGIECLSLIPGTAGATPVQNVSAYGQEIAQVLTSLTAYDRTDHQFKTLATSDCQFGYRKSCFNTEQRGRYFISNITLHLTKTNPQPPFYAALSTYLEEQHISTYTPAVIRQAVIAIRQKKLPDIAIIPNSGSFFANPIVDQDSLDLLLQSYSDIPHWRMENGTIKLSAAWMIDRAGYHAYFDQQTGIGTWDNQSLVLINKSAKSTADLLQFATQIQTKVKQLFNVTLIVEPQLLPYEH